MAFTKTTKTRKFFVIFVSVAKRPSWFHAQARRATCSGLLLPRVSVGAGDVDHGEGRGWARITDFELIGESVAFECRLGEWHQQPRRALLEAGGSKAPFDSRARDRGDQL